MNARTQIEEDRRLAPQDILLIETLAANAWPPQQSEELDGWRLRSAGGITRRANSVWPNALGGQVGLEERLSAVERHYSALGLPSIFQICAAAQPPDLDEILAARGYSADAHTFVQTVPLRLLLQKVPPLVGNGSGGFAIEIGETFNGEWFAFYCRSEEVSGHAAAVREDILRRIAPPHSFALLRIGGEPAAVGLGVVESDWLGIFCMATLPRFRRRGAASALLRALALWGETCGAEHSYLQVMQNNAPAQQLYAKGGFVTAYPYHYRIKDDPLPAQPPTERRNPHSQDLDRLGALELAALFNREDARCVEAVAAVLPDIARAIEMIGAVLLAGGRWFLVGAGTSGRLALLDALELQPTFNLPPGMVIPLLAGGPSAAIGATEDVEDDAERGAADLRAHNLTPDDIVLGVAASGRTPYVLGALGFARSKGATTIALACNPLSAIGAAADLAIEPVPGPEVLTGSTRLKAGTTQKMVLNMLSTGVMVGLGKAYSNLMVDVQPTNSKLRARAIRIVADAALLDPQHAEQLLAASGWEVKTAVVMALTGTDAAAARARLAAALGHVRGAIKEES
jgi:N-acetylmuramic acid 6-phosphate etherase